MTTQTLQQTLSQTTVEHLGPEATAADLKAFRAALTAAWPTGEVLDTEAAQALSDKVFEAGEWATAQAEVAS